MRKLTGTSSSATESGRLNSLVGGLTLQYLDVTRAVLLVAGIQGLITLAGLANRNVRDARWPEEA